MNSKMILKLALSGVVIGVPTAGCANMNPFSAKGVSSVEKLAKQADKNARRAEKYLAKGDLEKAVTYAEAAVEGDLTNAEYRGILARIYMAQGKFKSAERTLMDVMELGVSDPRTVVSLTLARIAQGRAASAISMMEANRSLISDSDFGLALALAGEEKRAVEVLTEAIRADGAGARVRQNLALAYAMDGRWREARIMASQDLAQEAVNEQISEWAHYARPGAFERRVAGLLNVTPQADAGQPVRLALTSNGTGFAQAAAVNASTPVDLVPSAVRELAPVGPAPIATSAGFAAAEKDVSVSSFPAMDAPLIKAPEGPVKSAMASQPKSNATPVPSAKPASKTPVKLALAEVEPRQSAQRSVTGTHIVQLGAFSSSESAKAAWAKYSKNYSVLQGFGSASSTVTVDGKKLIRLAAMGFGNKSSAEAVCKSIQAKGGSCMVRSVGSTPPVRLASR